VKCTDSRDNKLLIEAGFIYEKVPFIAAMLEMR
jgi:hypothetical protein